jgi:hypothetical protein
MEGVGLCLVRRKREENILANLKEGPVAAALASKQIWRTKSRHSRYPVFRTLNHSVRCERLFMLNYLFIDSFSLHIMFSTENLKIISNIKERQKGKRKKERKPSVLDDGQTEIRVRDIKSVCFLRSSPRFLIATQL